MKSTSLWLILFSISISISVTSCKKDKDDNTTDPNAVSGSFTFAGATYTFKGAFGEKYGADPTLYDGFNIDLILYSDGLTVISNNGVPDSIFGNGAIIYLESFTSSENSLADGQYSFGTSSPSPLFSFSDYSDLGVGNYTTFNITNTDISGGTYTIQTQADGRRNISFNLNLDGGNKITGTYTGPITYY